MDLLALGGTLQGEAIVPPDKSITHRAIIMGSIAQKKTTITGLLAAYDCIATLEAMRSLGSTIKFSTDHEIVIEGVGLQGLTKASKGIDCGNSGTSIRLLAGLLAGMQFDSILYGDDSLQRRPMERIVIPLRQMGADITGKQGASRTTAPLHIGAHYPLQGINYSLPISSAQVKSCLLLAGLSAKGQTTLVEKVPTRDHTERLLRAFGAHVHVHKRQVTLIPGKELQGQHIFVPGDISSAAFFITGAVINKNQHKSQPLILRNVGVNPRRIGILHILKQMGATIMLRNVRTLGVEPIADLEVYPSELKGIVVPREWVTSAIDEFPIIFIAACMAKGETHIRGVEELRYKESDRIAVMARGLQTLGVKLEVFPDGIMIEGMTLLKEGEVDSAGDHRVAMAFAVASLVAKGPLRILNCEHIATSFPNFDVLANQLGLLILKFS